MMMQREERRDEGTKRGGTGVTSTGTGRGRDTGMGKGEGAEKGKNKENQRGIKKLSKGRRRKRGSVRG